MGEVQEANAAPSRLHWKAVASTDVNAKVGVLTFVEVAGRCVMVAIGPVVSIVQPWLTDAPTLPARSVGRTTKVCAPSVRFTP